MNYALPKLPDYIVVVFFSFFFFFDYKLNIGTNFNAIIELVFFVGIALNFLLVVFLFMFFFIVCSNAFSLHFFKSIALSFLRFLSFLFTVFFSLRGLSCFLNFLLVSVVFFITSF